jgi:hypothetical protein
MLTLYTENFTAKYKTLKEAKWLEIQYERKNCNDK